MCLESDILNRVMFSKNCQWYWLLQKKRAKKLVKNWKINCDPLKVNIFVVASTPARICYWSWNLLDLLELKFDWKKKTDFLIIFFAILDLRDKYFFNLQHYCYCWIYKFTFSFKIGIFQKKKNNNSVLNLNTTKKLFSSWIQN